MNVLKRLILWLTKERGKDSKLEKVGYYTPMDIAPGEVSPTNKDA